MGSHDTTVEDIVSLQRQGYRIVVVHGGGKTINQWLNNSGIDAKFINGLRVTDIESLKIVSAVLTGMINKEIVSQIINCGGKAVGISGADGKIIQGINKNPELGYVGEEFHIDTSLLNLLIKENYIPVIAPICFNMEADKNNESYLLNVNGDTAAAQIAASLSAEQLIFLTDVGGLYDADNEIIEHITVAKAQDLINRGVITGGMVVKIKACIDALSKIPYTRIIDGRISHALINEIKHKKRGTTIAQN